MAAQNKFNTCTFILKKCDFANSQLAPTCVKNWCLGQPYGFGPCTEVYHGAPADCCSRSTEETVASCMANFQRQQGFGGSGGSNNDACLAVQSYAQNCAKVDLNFNHESYKQQAKCLCYDNDNNYDPDPWDNAVATCVSTGQQAHPTIWSLIQTNSPLVGLCTNFASGSSPGSVTVSTTAHSVTTTASSANNTPTGGIKSAVDSTTTQTPTGTALESGITPVPSSPTTSATEASNATATTTRSGASRAGHSGMSYSHLKWAAIGLGVALPVFMITI